MAKIVDLKQGTGNVFPRTIGEAVAVGGKLLTEAISTLDEKVSAVDDLISGEPTGTVMVAPNAENIVIGNTDKSNLFIGTNNSFYMDYKGKTTIGANSNKIEVDPEYDTIKIGNKAAPTNLINITRSELSMGVGDIVVTSDREIKIGTPLQGRIIIGTDANPIVLETDGSIRIGADMSSIKVSQSGLIVMGTNGALTIGTNGVVTFGTNVNIPGGSGLDITSGSLMKIGCNTTSDIQIGTEFTGTLFETGKEIYIQNDSYTGISMSTSQGVNIKGAQVVIGKGTQQIKLGSDNNLTIGYNDAIKINPEGKITFSENSGVPVNTDNTVKLSKITPSGDLQHYMYEQIGAIYNDTDSDIVRDAPWADLVDDDNPDDKYVTHKAGYWYMNGLGDLTNKDMRNILTYGKYIPTTPMCNSYPCTVRTVWNKGGNCHSAQLAFCNNTYIKSITLFFLVHSYDHFLYNCRNLKYVCSIHSPKTDDNMFYNCLSLQYIGLCSCYANIFIQYSPLLSAKSVLYMIQNAQTTTNFTIILHDDAYARAIGNADVIAALEAKPNITLASDSGLEYNGTTTTSTTTGMASSTTSTTTSTASSTASGTTSSSTTSTTTPQS